LSSFHIAFRFCKRSNSPLLSWSIDPYSGGLGLLLLEEEAGGLDAATGSGGLRLGILGLLNDGLEPRRRATTSMSSGMVTARGREPAAVDE
jgi:hypothetical protein